MLENNLSDFELTAPMQSEDPGGTRVARWHEMEGKTVRCVIEWPAGRHAHGVAAVIVFEDDCWATLIATSNGTCDDDGASLELTQGYYGAPAKTLVDYLHPNEMLDARMVNQGQYEYLLQRMGETEKAEKAARRARLLAEAEKLA